MSSFELLFVQIKVKGAVPDKTLTSILPSIEPKQLASIFVWLSNMAGGSLIVADIVVLHPLLSIALST